MVDEHVPQMLVRVMKTFPSLESLFQDLECILVRKLPCFLNHLRLWTRGAADGKALAAFFLHGDDDFGSFKKPEPKV